MATDKSEPRVGLITVLALGAVVTLIGLRFFFQSYFIDVAEEQQRIKVWSTPASLRDHLREEAEQRLEHGPMPIATAMQRIAAGDRPAVIAPHASTDYAALVGWTARPANLTPPPAPAPAPTPAPEPGTAPAATDGGVAPTAPTGAAPTGAAPAPAGAAVPTPAERPAAPEHGAMTVPAATNTPGMPAGVASPPATPPTTATPRPAGLNAPVHPTPAHPVSPSQGAAPTSPAQGAPQH